MKKNVFRNEDQDLKLLFFCLCYLSRKQGYFERGFPIPGHFQSDPADWTALGTSLNCLSNRMVTFNCKCTRQFKLSGFVQQPESMLSRGPFFKIHIVDILWTRVWEKTLQITFNIVSARKVLIPSCIMNEFTPLSDKWNVTLTKKIQFLYQLYKSNKQPL